jgi:hypothetical protein
VAGQDLARIAHSIITTSINIKLLALWDEWRCWALGRKTALRMPLVSYHFTWGKRIEIESDRFDPETFGDDLTWSAPKADRPVLPCAQERNPTSFQRREGIGRTRTGDPLADNDLPGLGPVVESRGGWRIARRGEVSWSDQPIQRLRVAI